MLGFITGNRSGVSTVPLLVLSLPILASRSFSFVSKLIGEPKQISQHAYKILYYYYKKRLTVTI
jgi:hypothetical protein